MRLNAPVPVKQQPGDARALWRSLLLEGVDPAQPIEKTLAVSLFTTSVLSGVSLMRLCDELVELGLRAPPEALPAPWVAQLRSRVLHADQRRDMPYSLAALAASWCWMPMPFVRVRLPHDICPEHDPYGADLCQIFLTELGPMPRFGYRAAQLRATLLRCALSLGQPIARVLGDLIDRGLVLPAEAVPEASRIQMFGTPPTELSPLVAELVKAWRTADLRHGHFDADVVPLKRLG
jgi:hypothetical protein